MTPAAARDETAWLVRLNNTMTLGARQAEALRTAFGSWEAVFRQTPGALQGIKGIGPQTAQAILDPDGQERAAAELSGARAAGFRILPFTDPGYPERLRGIHNPPLVLYTWGDPAVLSEPLAVAVVGSRRATVYGKLQANRLGRELAELGFLVVSGLARGVDGAAHAGVVSVKGKTAAFLGSGLRRIYPSEHKKLAAEIVKCGGAIVSEFPLDAKPLPQNFPRRNRLVSGLSLGVVVVEATERSGALSTAGHAAEQGREVFAVPGRIDSPTSRGAHKLIRDGAKLVESVEDILVELSEDARAELSARASSAGTTGEALTPEEERVAAALSGEPASVDELILASGLPAAQVAAALTSLELKRRARRLPGMMFARAL